MINYTWEVQVIETEPYNINSGQANIIKQATFTLKGVDSEKPNKFSEAAGAVVWNHENGVSGTFTKIEDVTKETIEGWIKARLGEETITELKTGIANSINAMPDDFIMAPEE